MTGIDRNGGIFEGVDRVALLLYGLILLVGTLLITAASYDENSVTPLFDFSHFYVKQCVWVAVAFVVAMFVLLLDDRFYHMYAQYLYIGGLLVLMLTLTPLGREVNGAKAWFEFGSFRVQPIEFTKIATALMTARLMSEYSFSITRFGDLLKVAIVLLIPMAIVVLQNDTGSGVVLGSFLFVLYREGLNKWLCIPVLLVAALFIVSLLLTPVVLLLLSISVCTLSEAMMTGEWRSRIVFLASILLGSLLLYCVGLLAGSAWLDGYHALLIVTLAAMAVAAIHAFRAQLNSTFLVLAIFAGSLIFLPSTDYLFNHILKPHQQDRLKSYLGIIDDPSHLDYNVNQAKIAIGSGGLAGKGFLQGTQIKYGFVPERHTDFIFCVAGEEWGFAGATVLLFLLLMLILRLMRMGERQEEPFGRIYCYCVAAILFFHVLVNVGMTIGLVPVMGIPLPLVSYGGSSLIAFTILIFIAIRLDASTRQFSFNRF